jgi:GntR family transcriptional regulator
MFLLDFTGKVPIFEQIQTQILRFIEAGVLRPGDRLPSVRQIVHLVQLIQI